MSKPPTSKLLACVCRRASSDTALVSGDEVLLGQKFFEEMDRLADCAANRLIPNPAHPNVAVSKLK